MAQMGAWRLLRIGMSVTLGGEKWSNNVRLLPVGGLRVV